MITGESNFDEKNVEEVFNLCSTEQSCINIGITCYKIGTLSEKILNLSQRLIIFRELRIFLQYDLFVNIHDKVFAWTY